MTEYNKLLQEIEWDKMFEKWRTSLGKLSEAAKRLYQDDGIQAISVVNEQIRIIAKDLPRFSTELPAFVFPEETLTIFRRLRYLSFLEKSQWPLFLLIDDSLISLLEPYVNNNNFNSEQLTNDILSFLTNEYIEALCMKWEQYDVIQSQRLPVLKEAVQLFLDGYYYGCTALSSCQLYGIISDIYQLQLTSSKGIIEENLELIFEYYNYNSQKTKSDYIKKHEKNQLLVIYAHAESGFFYWKACVDYLHNTILTSKTEMAQSNHPCRNKICHGIQLNFGTREHAVKSILAIDMIIKLAQEIALHCEDYENC